jgi:hypothetical protein
MVVPGSIAAAVIAVAPASMRRRENWLRKNAASCGRIDSIEDQRERRVIRSPFIRLWVYLTVT